MKNLKIIGILIKDRIKEAGKTQKILSQYSSIIQSRLGFHELNEDVCSRQAFVILHLKGEPEEQLKLEAELKEVGGIDVQNMQFEY